MRTTKSRILIQAEGQLGRPRQDLEMMQRLWVEVRAGVEDTTRVLVGTWEERMVGTRAQRKARESKVAPLRSTVDRRSDDIRP